VSVRLPLAFLLGVAAAVLIACGGSNKKLLPAVSADRLKNDLADVSQAIDQQDCAAAAKAFTQFQADLQRVPATVDRRLRQRLNEGASRLSNRVPVDCKGAPRTTTTTVPTTTTTTPATTTTTTPTTTTTTPTTTTTTPTTTTTTPTDTTTTGPSNGGTPPSTTP
jgi:hypothetical protein